jgi:hypothetical protein
MLMGDSWMTMPSLVRLSQEHEVLAVVGTYSLPVWLWALRHVDGAQFRIVRVIPDPDSAHSDLCPGKGYRAIDAGAKIVKEMYPEDTVLLSHDIGSEYSHPINSIALRDVEVFDGDSTVVHPYSRHDWKNVDDSLLKVKFQRPVKVVGKPGEVVVPVGWKSLAGELFEVQVRAVLEAAGFAGVLSSFTNLAALFGKRQVIASFTQDVPIVSPNAVILVRPSFEDLEGACLSAGL